MMAVSVEGRITSEPPAKSVKYRACDTPSLGLLNWRRRAVGYRENCQHRQANKRKLDDKATAEAYRGPPNCCSC